MNKKIKLILWIFFILLIIFAMIIVVKGGDFGKKVQYYYLKHTYSETNPHKKPIAVINIDLRKDINDIKNNSHPSDWLYFFEWWPKPGEKEKRIGLRTKLPDNPFDYFTANISLDNITFTITNIKVVIVQFKEYKNLKSNIMPAKAKGIDSLKISCIEAEPVIEHGQLLNRKISYEFAFDQHKKLESTFTNLSLYRDVHADEVEKQKRNKDFKISKYIRCLEYKNWIKDNFEFTLILEEYNNEYYNYIYINPLKMAYQDNIN